MSPTNQRLLRRYAAPLGILILLYASPFVWPPVASWVGVPPIGFAAYLMGLVPVASLWLFWLIAREPRADPARGKALRSALILLLLAPAVAVLIAGVGVMAHDDEGPASAIAILLLAPWALIQIVAGAIALWSVNFQRFTSSEPVNTPIQPG